MAGTAPDGAQALGVEQGAAKLISLGANSADKEPPRAAMRKQCNLRGNGPADLTGHVEANPALTTRHAGLSRAEPGCEAFEVNPDLANCRKFVLFERYRDEAPCGHVERRPAALDLVRLRRHWCVPAMKSSSGAASWDRSWKRRTSVAPSAAGRLDGGAMCQARQNLRSSIHKSGWNSGFPMYTLS
jgi:quinol monooxygenase YgiN